ncbi:CPBP family intramembrane glutamic endopeptidase [Murinocardiopsis flavida]|nr:CPBP family intramembrane glutamic endopeptidase [Murinocardiopsis flavida]
MTDSRTGQEAPDPADDEPPAPALSGPAGDEPPRTSALPEPAPLSRRMLVGEVLVVLALSLGASAISATISFIGAITARVSLSRQTASLITSRADGRPWLDLAWQLYSLAFALVPVVLVVYLLYRSRESHRTMGFDARRPAFDALSGAGLAAAIGAGGLLVYLVSYQLGLTVQVKPSALPENWWTLPVLVLQAAKNGVLEEVIVVGYLLVRLRQLGWSPAAAIALSSVLRAFYHLYQGVGMFFGNLVMGVVFGWFYHRYGRVMPLVVAHTVIDVVAFVGSIYLIGRVDWLPGG